MRAIQWNYILASQLLAVSDLWLVLGCALLYGLPDLWYAYDRHVYPVILPYLLPTVQIAMMTSVYCTIVMSFERYARVGGNTCGIACITEANFR